MSLDGLSVILNSFGNLILKLSIPTGIAFFIKEYYWPAFIFWQKIERDIITCLNKYDGLRLKRDWRPMKNHKGWSQGGLIPDAYEEVELNLEVVTAAATEFRKVAGELKALKRIKGYRLLSKFGFFPNEQKVDELTSKLNKWASEMNGKNEDGVLEKIKKQIIQLIET